MEMFDFFLNQRKENFQIIVPEFIPNKTIFEAKEQSQGRSLASIPNDGVGTTSNFGQLEQFRIEGDQGQVKNSLPKNDRHKELTKSLFTKDLSSKKIYFQTLYSEYLALLNFTEQKSVKALDSCPQFHNTFLDMKEYFSDSSIFLDFKNEKSTKRKNLFMPQNINFQYPINFSKLKSEEYLSLNPELLLPVVDSEKFPRAVDVILKNGEKNPQMATDVVKDAINIHMEKTHRELRELCQNGVSSNYYIFENLYTHAKSEGLTSNTESVRVLYKTTIFSNLALISSLEKKITPAIALKRSLASNHSYRDFYSEQLFSYFQVPWAKEYFMNLGVD